MFEAKNKPLRPVLQTAPQTRNARPTDAQRPRSAPLSNARRSARLAHTAKCGKKNSKASETFTAAREITTQAAQEIRSQFGEGLTREESLTRVNAFRAGVVPRRKSGRRPKPQITDAFRDWKAGMCGVVLYRKHISGWERHNRYHRIGEQKALMDAIRSRVRRERTVR
jgi:hypothetical protein